MNFFKIILLLVTNFNTIYSYDYLNNHKVDYNISQLNIDFWHDDPLTGYHNSYPPTGINSPLSITLKSFTWVSRGVSPISSRKIVLLSADSK